MNNFILENKKFAYRCKTFAYIFCYILFFYYYKKKTFLSFCKGFHEKIIIQFNIEKKMSFLNLTTLYIRSVALPVVILLGSISNLLAILLMKRTELSGLNFYIIILAFTDIGIAKTKLTDVYRRKIKNFFFRNFIEWWYKFVALLCILLVAVGIIKCNM